MKPYAIVSAILAIAVSAFAAPCPDPGPLPHELGTAMESVRSVVSAGRFAEALSRLDAALARTPENRHPYPHLLRGQILLSLGRAAEAESTLTEALKRDPCAAAGWRNLAAARHGLDRPGPAAEATERALALETDAGGELRYQAAAFHLAAGAPGRAIPHLERLAGWQRPRAEWLASLGDAYEQAGRTADAAGAYARAAGIGGAAEDRYRAGRAFLVAGQPGKAAEALAPLAEAGKGRAEWFLALGEAMARIGKTGPAADALARAFREHGDFDAGLRAARLRLDAGDRAGAVSLLRSLAKTGNPSADRSRSLSGALARAGHSAEAAAVLAASAERTGVSADRYQAALLYLKANRPDAALPLLRILAESGNSRIPWLTTLAAVLEQRGADAEAARIWERAFRRSGDPDHGFRAAVFHRKVGDFQRALVLMESISGDEDAADRGAFRADLLAHAGRWDEAARTLESLGDFGDRPDLLGRAATLWERAGHPEKAMALLRDLADRPDAAPEWRSELARLLIRSGATDEAEALMDARSARSDDPAVSAEMAEVRAEWFLESQRPAEALPMVRELAEKPDAAPRWGIALAETLRDLGERDAALEAAERVGEAGMARFSPEDVLRLAAFWLSMDRPEAALRVLDAGASAGKSSDSHDFPRAEASAALERWEEAEAALARMRKRRPSDPAVWRVSARIGIRRERFGEAAADLAVAFRLSPPEPAEWRRLGDLYARAGVFRQAAETYRRAFGDSPTPEELDRLSATLERAGDPEAARKAAEAAAESAPTRERWNRVGNLSMGLRDFAGAREAFARAAELDDPDGAMSYRAGYAAWREGNFAAAKEALQRAMARAENGGETIAKVRRLLEMVEGVG
jgi:tetratricopeptide (TPR) repeat protein